MFFKEQAMADKEDLMKIYGIVIDCYTDDIAYLGDDDATSPWQKLHPKLYTEKRRAEDCARSLQQMANKENSQWNEVYYSVRGLDITLSLIDFENRKAHREN